MAIYYNIKLTSGTSSGPYTIYYDTIGPSNIATIISSGDPASGLNYNTVTIGVNVSVPDNATSIYVYNTTCSSSDIFQIPAPSPTPTLTSTPTLTPTITVTPTVDCSFGIGVVVLAPSPTPTTTVTSTATVTPTITPTLTPAPTSDVTSTPTVTPTNTGTPAPTSDVTSTPTPTITPTVDCSFGIGVVVLGPSQTPTPTHTSAVTSTPTVTPTPTTTSEVTSTPTVTPTTAATSTPAPTSTPASTPTLPALSVSVSSATLQTCWNSNDASFTLSASGGNGAPYEYSRDNSNWQSSDTFSGLAGTSYTGYVRNDDRLGTVASTAVGSLARSQPEVSVSSAGYPSCWNSSNGSLVLSGSGGSGTFYYSIDNGANYQYNDAYFPNLTSQTYYIRVKDTNNCESQSLVPYNLTTGEPSADFTPTNISCNGGSDGTIATSVINSNGIYYRYNAGAGFTNTSGTRYNVGTSRGSLTSGSYTFRIYNSNESCYKDYTITLTQPTLQTASITSIVGATSGDNGSLTISSGGGTWNKTYRLYKDSTTPYNDYPTDNLIATYSNVTAGSPSFNVTGLACGYYWLQVTDANGCQTNTIAYQVTCPTPAVTYYPVELRTGQAGDNSDFGSACYNLANGALMDVVIYTETGYFDDGYQAYTNSGTLYTGLGYYTDGINYGRIIGGTITLQNSCTGGPVTRY